METKNIQNKKIKTPVFNNKKTNTNFLDFYETEFSVEYPFYTMPFADIVAAEFEGVDYEGTAQNPTPDIKRVLKEGAQAYLTEKFLETEILRYSPNALSEEALQNRSIKIGVDVPDLIAFLNSLFKVKIHSISRVEFTRVLTKSLDKQPQESEMER